MCMVKRDPDGFYERYKKREELASFMSNLKAGKPARFSPDSEGGALSNSGTVLTARPRSPDGANGGGKTLLGQ